MVPKLEEMDSSGFCKPKVRKDKKIRQLARKKARIDKSEGRDCPDFVKAVTTMEKKHRRSMDIWEALRVFNELKLEDDYAEPHCAIHFGKWFPSCKTLRRRKKHLVSICDHGDEITSWLAYIMDGKPLPVEYMFFPTPHAGRDPPSHYDASERNDDGVPDYIVGAIEKLQNVITHIKELAPDSDQFVSFFEDITGLIYLLMTDVRWDAITLYCIQLIKNKCGSSFTSVVEKTFRGFLDLGSENFLTESNKSDPEPQSFESFKYLRNFSTFVRSKFFLRIHKMLSLLVTYGFVNPIHITMKGLELFSVQASEKITSATDLFEYVIDLFTYFVESGYKVYCGDYSVFNDIDELNKIDRDIIFLSTNIDKIFNGSFEIDTKQTIGEYKDLLMKTYSDVEFMARTVKDKITKQNVVYKLERLAALVIKFNTFNYMGGMRKAPFALSLYGKSSVGKSSVANILINSILTSNGYCASDENICTLQPDDKFYSTYKQNTLAVIIDDVSNTISAKATVNPAAMIISLVNNIKYTAPKADTKDKGMFQVEPRVVIATTNVRDLGASQWSEEPISVLRRMNYHLTIKVRAKYSKTGKDGGKLNPNAITNEDIEFQANNGFSDFWLIDISEVISKCDSLSSDQNSQEPYDFRLVTLHDGRIANDLTIAEVVKFLNLQSHAFYEQQESMVKSAANSGKRMSFCTVCKGFRSLCSCEEEPEPHSFIAQKIVDVTMDKVTNYIYSSANNFMQDLMPTPIERFFSDKSSHFILTYIHNKYFSLLRFIPISVRETDFYKSFHYYRNRHQMIRHTQYLSLGIFTTVFGVSYKYLNQTLMDSFTNGLGTMVLSGVISWRAIYARTMEDLKTVPYNDVIDSTKMANAITSIFKAGVSLTTALVVVKLIKSLYQLCRTVPHGNLTPNTYADIEERDNEVNCWKKEAMPFEDFPQTQTMTADQLCNKVAGNCLHASMDCGSYTKTTGVFVLRSTMFMCPLHFFHVDNNISGPRIHGSFINGVFEPDRVTLTLFRHTGNSFKVFLNVNDVQRIGDHDLCIFNASSGGTFNDILPYITDQWSYNGPVKVIGRELSGDELRWYGTAERGYESYRCKCLVKFRGGKYQSSIPTQKGMCSSPLISDSSSPRIIGFHIAGYSNANRGFYITAIRSELEVAIDKLVLSIGIVEPNSASTFRTVRYGQSLDFKESVSELSPVCWQETEPYKIRGTIDAQSTYYTNIRPSIMAKTFYELTATEPTWGPPQFRPSYWPWNEYLTHARSPIMNMEQNLLMRAKLDYLKPLLKLFATYKDVHPCSPLDEKSIINGIDGLRFIDSMNFSSSFGFPIKGTKRKHLVGDIGSFTFDNIDDIRVELLSMENRYRHKKRYYPIFKACLKDEPIKRTKKKVRVFHAADMALQFALRKYFLPIMRLLHANPLVSESAVGINPHSDEWDQMHKYVTHNGIADNRIIAGDYSKWDIKLPPDVVMMAFSVLIELASKLSGYTEDDLIIMKGLATDVTFFVCHFNGTLIEFVSGVPSGHNLTALLNSICNSLLLRCGYFSTGGKGAFRLNCHAMTYGDDFFLGLLETCKTFNHIVYRDFLSRYGLVLTMPNKEDAPTNFMNIWECDFLKRRSVICPYDGIIYGALDMSSINKSIVVKGKTSVSPRTHAFDVLTGCIRELSYHDKAVYDDWIVIYRRIAKELNFLIMGMYLDHEGYYKYRSGFDDGPVLHNYETSSHLRAPLDYPMTSEASGETAQINNLSDVSNSDGDDSFELGYLEHSNGLTNKNMNDSYPATKVQEGLEDLFPLREPEPHSGVFGNLPGVVDAAVTESGILHLSGAKEEKIIETDIKEAELLSLRQDESRSLSNYLTRPLLIAVYNITTDFDYREVTILRTFLESPRIRDKIRNYAYLNGVLNVKVTSVGSPQCSCALMAVLHPWFSRDNSLGAMSGAPTRQLDYVQMSQLPSFVVDLGAESGGHIRMPIIAPTNGLNISETEQIESAFRFSIKRLTPLYTPSTSSNIRPSIQVYAWIEDAKLTGTTLNSELPVPQSDEFVKDPDTVGSSVQTGFKEGIAAATGTMVGRATELGVEALMSAIGLSQPLRPQGVTPIVPRGTTNMSCYNSEQNIDSLASDIKNEVSLDTKQLGYEDYDHMAIENIATRWGLLGSLRFDTTTVAGINSEVKIIPVTPMATYFRELGGYDLFTPLPVGVAALPFGKWRGGLEYKFVAVGSSFLKGKLKISHDVNTRIKVGLAFRDPTDVQALNTVVWDISQYRTMTVQVPWASNLTFKDTGLLRDWLAPYEQVAELNIDSTNNGVLLIDKLTNCSDLEYTGFHVLVYVRAMPGMAFGDVRAVLANYVFAGVNFGQDPSVPEPQSNTILGPLPPGLGFDESGDIVIYTLTQDNLHYYLRYLEIREAEREVQQSPEPQSDIRKAQADVTTFGSQLSSTEMIVNICGIENSIEDNGLMAELCMGEKFFSIRQIIKRYTENFTRNISFSGTGQSMQRFRIPDRPILKGWQGPNSINVTPQGKKATYARDSFLSFFSVCFLGYRGSHRHKVIISLSDGNQRSATTYIARAPAGYLDEKLPHNATAINASASSILNSPDVRAGGLVLHNGISNIAEYSTPFQCRAKFAWAQDRTPYTPKFTYDGGYDIPWHQIAIMAGEASGKWMRMSKFVAAGDDYTLFFYMYSPVMTSINPSMYSQT